MKKFNQNYHELKQTRPYVLILVILVSFLSFSGIPLPAMALSPTGLMVPLYDTAGSKWDPVIQAKTAHPAVPMVAIINNGGGPGISPNTNYTTLVGNLHTAGIIVLGYTWTQYGSRNITDIRTDIDNYKNWYNVDGIFIDEMSYAGGDERYYSNLNHYAKSIGLTMVVGNPGTETLPSYVGTVDNIIIHENPGMPSIDYLGGWHASYDKRNWGILPYSIDSLDKSYVLEMSKYLGYIFVGNGTYPEPWGSLPPYFMDLVDALDPVLFHLTVNSQDSNGRTLTGYYTTLNATNGTLLDAGYTPYNFTLNKGHTYTVQVDAGYNTYVFDHWQDTGSTNSSRNISISSDNTITAIYKNNNTGSAP